MSIGVVDLFFSTIVAGLGILTGWVWRRATQPQLRTDGDKSPRFDEARNLLSRLQSLAAGVAADVGQHNTEVEAINERLTAEGGNDAVEVVTAVSQLLEANNRMQRQLDSAEEQLRQQAQEIESQTAAARTDALTGLANRRVFDDEIDSLMGRFRQDGVPFSVTILDIDHFKEFNDTHGHQVGDCVLQHTARVYVDSVSETDVVTRFGGEEFAVIHPATTVEEATRRADALREALENSTIRGNEQELRVTVSLGVAASHSGENPEELIARADAALYAAKRAGRNRTYWHDGRESHPMTQPTSVTMKPATHPEPEARPIKAEPRTSRAVEVEKNLMDRPRFLSKLDGAIGEAAGHASRWPTLLLVQIDRFDDHADRHGGTVGERMLDAVATVLLAAAHNNGAVARFDPQTFSVLLSGFDEVRAIQMAEQIRELSRQCPLPTSAGPLQFTLSMGTARAFDDEEATRLMGRAKQALDSAKQAGGDCTFCHNGKWSQIATTVVQDAACPA